MRGEKSTSSWSLFHCAPARYVAVLPPRDIYRVEAVTRSDEPNEADWNYFLELWTEDGLARLHIEGRIDEESDGRLVATFDDILP